MYVISVGFLVWAWKKLQNGYSTSVTPMLAVSSAFVFAAQMINFPIFFGASGHLVGGTFLAILLGPYAAILSMTIVVLMQAVIFVDGGISTFGANLFNMAIIGGLSFFVVKALIGKSQSSTRFFASIFAASWISVMLGCPCLWFADWFFSLFCTSRWNNGNSSNDTVLARNYRARGSVNHGNFVDTT